MANKRLHFGVLQAGIAKNGSQTFTAIKGLQSVGMTTSFNIQGIFQLGMVPAYTLVEQIPDIELTLEKVLDGTAPVYTIATQDGVDGTLIGRSNPSCIYSMSVFTDTQLAASGTPISQVQCSGSFVSQYGYALNADGNATETISLVANNKVWTTGVGSFTFTGAFTGSETPLFSGGIARRQHLIFTPPTGLFGLDTNGQVNASFANPCTILPPEIDGISTSGTNNSVGGVFGAHVQSFQTSVDLGRTPLTELGRRVPYFRFVQLPVTVSTAISTYGIKWDNTQALEGGLFPNGDNTTNRTIKFALQEGLFLNMGTKNRLNTTNWTGGDTGGGNVVITYNYINYDDYTVLHPADPSGFTA